MSSAKLCVLTGAPGAGKTTLAHALSQYGLVVKDSERPPRNHDTDVRHVDEIDLRGNETGIGYVNYEVYTYLMPMSRVREGLDAGLSQVVVSTNVMTNKLLRSYFPEMVEVFIHRELDAAHLRKILSRRGLRGRQLEDAFTRREFGRKLLYDQLASVSFNRITSSLTTICRAQSRRLGGLRIRGPHQVSAST